MPLSVPSCGQARTQRRFHVATRSGHCRCAGVLPEGASIASGSSSAQGHTRWPCTEPPGVATLATRAPCLAPSQSSEFKYLINVIEQDHRAIKRRCASMKGFKAFANAAVTIAGIELAHRIHKHQFSFGPGRPRNDSRFGPTGAVHSHENRLSGRDPSVTWQP